MKERAVRGTQLRSIGFFRELAVGDSSGPSLSDCRSDTPLADEAQIVRYLDSGPVLMWSPVLVRDVLDPDTVIGTQVTRTDGVWQWPDDLSYYVSHYHVRLDPEFIAHMASHQWIPPAPSEINVDVSQLLGIADDATDTSS